MNVACRLPLLVAAILFAGEVCQTNAFAQRQPAAEELPLFEELANPTAAELLKERAYDWIVLKNGRVIEIEPITPRPFPLAWVEAIIFDHLRKKPDEIRDGQAALDEWRAARQKMDFLNIILRDASGKQEETDFRIHIKYIERFVHFEDHIVGEISRRVKQGDLKTAYELLVLLTRRDTLRIREFRKMEQDLKQGKAVPKLQVAENTFFDKAFKFDPEKEIPWNKPWPGLAKAQNQLLFADAKQLQRSNRLDDAIIRVEEIHTRDKFFNGLRNLAGELNDSLIKLSTEEKDYRRARYYISRLSTLYPSHEIASRWKKTLIRSAEKEMAQGLSLFNQNKKSAGVRKVRDALSIWPDSSEIKREYRRVASRYQILRVGVMAENTPENDPFESTSQRRHRKLVHRPLMHVDYYRDGTPHYASDYFEDWVPTDLGRRLRFKLRKSRESWESHAVIQTADVLNSLNRHLQPDSPQFDERLAVFVDSLAPVTPHEFVIRLRSIPTRPEALIDLRLGKSPSVGGNADNRGPSNDDEFAAYVVNETASDETTFVRKYPEPSDLLDFRVAEISEKPFSSFKELNRAFSRHEIDYIPHVWPQNVIQFEEDDRVFVQPYALPESHFLQFHPTSPILKLPNVRRAMQYALDREKLLVDGFLQKTELTNSKNLARMRRLCRLTTAPFASSLSGYNKLVQQAAYEPSTATALAFVDRAKLAAIGRPLKLLCSSELIATTVANRIVDAWKRVGIEAELVSSSAEADTEVEWDVAYRTTRLQDPVYDLAKLLAMKPHVTTEYLKYLPAWLLRELQNLDLVSDVRAAQAKVREIHSALAGEVIVIPLWEIDEFAIFRRNVRGFPKALVHPYHGIDRWVVQPTTNVE